MLLLAFPYCFLLVINLILTFKNRSSNLIAVLTLLYLQPIITQYFIDNKSEIWSLPLIVHSKG